MKRTKEDFLILSDTMHILFKNNCYPLGHVVDRRMKSLGFRSIQGADIDQFMRSLEKKAKKIDDELCKQSEWEFMDARIKKGNLPVSLQHSPSMVNSLKKLLWFTYLHSVQGGFPIETYQLFTKELSGLMNVTLKAGKLVDQEGECKMENGSFFTTITCNTSLKDYFNRSDTPETICRYSSDRQDLDLAIRIALFQKGGHKTIADVFNGYSFYIQKSYYKDFEQAHYTHDTSFLRSWLEAMTEILQNTHLDKREDYRTGKGGNNPQKFHGLYAAWRWCVTRSVKMQYWQKDKYYRFANVKEHDIFVCEWEED
ncbi:MAG: hypothetical protein ACI30I_12085 [Parabacteroides sp.]